MVVDSKDYTAIMHAVHVTERPTLTMPQHNREGGPI
jgi:hypothetical protein